MPRKRGKRETVAPGIYLDAIGYEVYVIVGGGSRRRVKTKRFPRDTGLRKMTAWQQDTRVALRKKTPLARTGTLSADCDRYLKLVKSMSSWTSRRSELQAWCVAFGDEKTLSLTAEHLQTQLEAWTAAGVADGTRNKRRNSLAQLFATLYKDAPNPVEGTAWVQPPDPAPRALPREVVDAILAAMPPSKTRARLRVLYETGLPPIRIMRLTPEQIDLERKQVALEGRRKGRGTRGRVMPLTARGVEAFKEFIAHSAFGEFRRSGYHVSFRRAISRVNVERAKQKLPPLPHIRPYDLRHSFGTRACLLMGGNVQAAAELLDCTEKTALRYTLAAVPVTMQRTIAALDQGDSPSGY